MKNNHNKITWEEYSQLADMRLLWDMSMAKDMKMLKSLFPDDKKKSRK